MPIHSGKTGEADGVAETDGLTEGEEDTETDAVTSGGTEADVEAVAVTSD